MAITNKADYHFLIDNARPKEVEYVLRCLNQQQSYSNEELRLLLRREFAYEAQLNLSFSSRRLIDLALARAKSFPNNRVGFSLSDRGAKVRSILSTDRDLYAEVMHYLHYDGFDGSPGSRKLFWSYKCCCDVVWENQLALPSRALAGEVQTRILAAFPQAYRLRVGGNFNPGGVSSGWRPWVAALVPSPLSSGQRKLSKRVTRRVELVLLSLDHVYRARGYGCGDPVVLDAVLLDELARVFFLEANCTRELLGLAAKLTRAVRLTDTFAGTSVTLLEPYRVEDI